MFQKKISILLSSALKIFIMLLRNTYYFQNYATIVLANIVMCQQFIANYFCRSNIIAKFLWMHRHMHAFILILQLQLALNSLIGCYLM